MQSPDTDLMDFQTFRELCERYYQVTADINDSTRQLDDMRQGIILLTDEV